MVQLKDIVLHHGDLPADIQFGDTIAVDTETLGLKPHRDKLCLVQLSAGDGICHLVRTHKGYDASNLKNLLSDNKVLKIFHFARFDIAVIQRYLGILCSPVYCTKIAAKLAITYMDRHGLKKMCHDILGVELCKQEQSSDWAADELSDAQLQYAASDVLYLHELKSKFDSLLKRDGRMEPAKHCFDFLPYRALLDLEGFEDQDIFSH